MKRTKYQKDNKIQICKTKNWHKETKHKSNKMSNLSKIKQTKEYKFQRKQGKLNSQYQGKRVSKVMTESLN